MSVQASYDPRDLSALIRRMQRVQSQITGGDYPMAKVLRNAGRDFAQTAYQSTRRAAVRTTPFLRVPAQGGGTRWVRKRRAKRPGLRGGATPQPPYPVAVGYARASWIGVFRDLGMGTRRPAARVPESVTRSSQATSAPMVTEVSNRLSYIGRLDARDGLVARGLDAARQRLTRALETKSRQLEDRWRISL